MFSSFLITFRETIEASLIVATIVTILRKSGAQDQLPVVKRAIVTAFLACLAFGILLLWLSDTIHRWYSPYREALIEGVLMLVTAISLTWIVLVVNRRFRLYKIALHQRIHTTLLPTYQQGLFLLVFTSLIREGMEIVLMLTSVIFSQSASSVISGSFIGIASGCILVFFLMRSMIRVPLYHVFRVTNVFLVMFAAGLLVRAVHELTEIGWLPTFPSITLSFIPGPETITGGLVTSLSGISAQMNGLQIALYVLYCSLIWLVLRSYEKRPLTSDI